jgi:MFS superfamily sulfate permease-like transporter
MIPHNEIHLNKHSHNAIEIENDDAHSSVDSFTSFDTKNDSDVHFVTVKEIENFALLRFEPNILIARIQSPRFLYFNRLYLRDSLVQLASEQAEITGQVPHIILLDFSPVKQADTPALQHLETFVKSVTRHELLNNPYSSAKILPTDSSLVPHRPTVAFCNLRCRVKMAMKEEVGGIIESGVTLFDSIADGIEVLRGEVELVEL